MKHIIHYYGDFSFLGIKAAFRALDSDWNLSLADKVEFQYGSYTGAFGHALSMDIQAFPERNYMFALLVELERAGLLEPMKMHVTCAPDEVPALPYFAMHNLDGYLLAIYNSKEISLLEPLESSNSHVNERWEIPLGPAARKWFSRFHEIKPCVVIGDDLSDAETQAIYRLADELGVSTECSEEHNVLILCGNAEAPLVRHTYRAVSISSDSDVETPFERSVIGRALLALVDCGVELDGKEGFERLGADNGWGGNNEMKAVFCGYQDEAFDELMDACDLDAEMVSAYNIAPFDCDDIDTYFIPRYIADVIENQYGKEQ